MKLYDNPVSPYAFKVRVALYEKGIAFEKSEIASQADRSALLALNPRGEVPTLVDGDRVVTDSKVICAYLEERFPEPALLPADPAGRARARSLELKADNEIDGWVFVLALLRLSRPALAGDVPGALLLCEEALVRHYAYLERELAGRAWFLGDFSLADVALAPHLTVTAFMGYPPGPRHPALDAWLARLGKRPSIRQARREMAASYAATQAEPAPMFTRRPHALAERPHRGGGALRTRPVAPRRAGRRSRLSVAHPMTRRRRWINRVPCISPSTVRWSCMARS